MTASNSTGDGHEGGGDKMYEAFLEDFIDFLDLETANKIVKEVTKMNRGNLDKKGVVEVLLRSADAEKVLNCRCCLKDILKIYVIKRKEIKMPPGGIGKSTKPQLVVTILQHWQKISSLAHTKTESKPNVADLMENAKEEKKDVKPYIAPVPQQASVGIQADPPAQRVNSEIQTTPNFCRDIVPLYAPAQEEEEGEEEEIQELEFPQTELERATGRQLAENFTEWFYARLNGLTDVQLQLTDFWLDCSFDMYIRLGAEVRKLTAWQDGVEVLRALTSLVAEYGCFFSPDMETGIGGIYTPHGLGQVVVRGAVLKGHGGAKMASFDQSFGLVRDPNYGGNFKVKYSVLNYCQEDSTNSVVSWIEEID